MNEEVEEKQEEIKGPEGVPITNIQKIYIKNYGNLSLDIQGTNDIGVSAYSEKRSESLFIPWTSIIMISKIDGEDNEPGN